MGVRGWIEDVLGELPLNVPGVEPLVGLVQVVPVTVTGGACWIGLGGSFNLFSSSSLW